MEKGVLIFENVILVQERWFRRNVPEDKITWRR
jgi:hypothetical protein